MTKEWNTYAVSVSQTNAAYAWNIVTDRPIRL